jgi:YVTN family beta-propeller protein
VIRPAGVLVLVALLASAGPASAAPARTAPAAAVTPTLPGSVRGLPILGLGAAVAVALPGLAGAAPDPRPSRRARRAFRSDRLVLHLVRTLSGGMAPKSVVATPMGRVFAMNVTYGHSITVFDRRFHRLKTISDEVPRSFLRLRYLADERVRGAPVEAAVSTDGGSLFVSQYSMYGPGFWEPGYDHCAEADLIDRSYVYRIDVRRLRKVTAYRVGEVPKFLAASPDGRTLLVANWCSMDVSVVDLKRRKEVARIPIGLNPRGIAFSPDGARAYVSVVGERRIAVLDMTHRKVTRWFDDVGVRPRHLVMAPTGRYLYVSVEGLDPVTGRVLGRIDGLQEPRTAILAPDGRALYVVDYLAGRLLKIDTSSMRLLQSVHLGYHPIGVTYDPAKRRVWVAGYGGTLWVLAERRH